MPKKQLKKEKYIPPYSKVVKVEFEGYLCQISGKLSPGGSSEAHWEDGGTYEGDESGWVGSTSEVAPAKESIWNEPED